MHLCPIDLLYWMKEWNVGFLSVLEEDIHLYVDSVLQRDFSLDFPLWPSGRLNSSHVFLVLEYLLSPQIESSETSFSDLEMKNHTCNSVSKCLFIFWLFSPLSFFIACWDLDDSLGILPSSCILLVLPFEWFSSILCLRDITSLRSCYCFWKQCQLM